MTRHQTGFGQPPALLNLGSGKDFRAEAFNIDIDATWTPDVVLDLSRLTVPDDGLVVATERFGDICLTPGCFSEIVANDVLEHVPDLVKLMTTCLRLLRVGGVFRVSVPYDLSFGAWQDPTHVRAFNERSWLYYTDWFWYLGWSEHRFEIETLHYVPSPFGEEMRTRGADRDEIVRTPRAIDSMSVALKKVPLSPEDQGKWQHWRERRARAAEANRQPIAAALGRTLQPFSGSWEASKDRYCIWTVSPLGYTHGQVFDEVALGLSQAFAENGGSAPVVKRPEDWGGRTPIVLGPHLLPADAGSSLPPGTVLFNMEQVDAQSVWMNSTYLALLKTFPVLDYSRRNLAALHGIGVPHAQHLPVGYAPGLTRIVNASEPDIDVLFYGCMNERRIRVMEHLRALGLNVVHLFDVYGAERDAAIARAKVVLNLHFYEAAIFEIVRVSFLLGNGKCVVSEGDPADPDCADLADGLALCAYDDLAARCAALVADANAREALAQRGLAAIRRRPQAAMLRSHFTG